MKSTTRLDSAVFQLTPTRTRCDLYIIANGKKEKIASGLVNPFIAHLKAAQDQIAQGGYSVLLAPEAAATNATWFTKCTVESFVRFVSTPEILERVYTIESEILQIEEAIAIQGNIDNSGSPWKIKDQYIKPVASNEGNTPAADVDEEEEEKAIVLYKPGAHELPSPSAKERNPKAQLINVLETRKTVLKKEQGMAFARAVAAGFEIENVANLLSFAECFGASRLMSGCLRFMELWKQKHESGQWVEIEEAEEAMSASAIVLSSMVNGKVRGGDAEKAGSNTNAAGGEQQYHGVQHPGFPPWVMLQQHSSPQGGGVPMYPMPYYHPGFYPPPPPYPSSSPIEDPNHFQKRQSMDRNTESEVANEEEDRKSTAGKKKLGRVVIRNINFINSKNETPSESTSSDTDTCDDTQQQKRNLRSPKRKGNHRDSGGSKTLNGKETDGGHWDAFQTYLLKSAEEGEREDMFAMEKESKTTRRQTTMGDSDPLSAHARHNDDGEGRHMQSSYDTSGRKIVSRSANDDCIMVGRREDMNVRDGNGFEEANFDKSNGLQYDEAVMVSLRSSSGLNDYNITKDLKMFDLSANKSNKPAHVVKYEPDALSLMPERDVEHVGYDPAIDYEMQLAASHEKSSKQDKKKGSKNAAEKHQLSKPNQGMVRKGRPSKVNNNNNNNKSTLEDARARADKLRSYKAELQKMRKEQQDAEQKRLEALKMERQKRISARTTNSSRKQLPSPSSSSSKLSPISHMRKSTKFTDSEPGSSSPLQRSKIRPASISSSKKQSTSSKNHSAAASGNRLTRSLSSMSDTKKDTSSVTNPHKTSSSMTHIRRLSEPRKINITPHTKTRSAESTVSKPKSSGGGPTDTKKISEPSNAAEVKITSSSHLISQKAKVMVGSEVAKQNLNNRLSDANDNPVVDKTVVMLERNKQPSSITTKSNHRADVPVETVDKGTISVHPQKQHSTTSSEEEEVIGNKYEAPYARVSSFEDQSTRNSEYAKAVPHHQAFSGTAAYLKMEKIPEKPQSKGGFIRLIKLGKKTTPSVQPPPPPQVDTLKSLISSDEHAQKSSRRLFSFQFRGEKKATGSGS